MFKFLKEWAAVKIGRLGDSDSATLTKMSLVSKRRVNSSILVVVPVYNAFDLLVSCVRAIENTAVSAVCRVVIINDGSTDQRVSRFLKSIEEDEHFEVIDSESNRGFTSSVNLGLSLSRPDEDVIILNSDAYVTPGWIEALQAAAYSDKDIGTVTPVSDYAGAFSFPEPGKRNPVPEGWSQEQYARYVREAIPPYLIDVPTGHGFCMYIRRDCLDKVGKLDEKAFPRGYGEENDFCQRAIRQGFRNVMLGSTIVYHHGSASFNDEKQQLLASGKKVLAERYPGYSEDVRRCFGSRVMQQLRQAHTDAFNKAPKNPKQYNVQPRFLYVISTITGGTPQTNQDLMGAMADTAMTYVLRCDSRVITLSLFEDGVSKELERYELNEPITPFPHTSDEYDSVVSEWLFRYQFSLVHVRHIGWHSLGLLRLVKAWSLPLVFSFHDYYTICPTVKLLDNNMRFCGGECTLGAGHCKHELWPPESIKGLKHSAVYSWQGIFEKYLGHCDAFVTTSEQVKGVISKRYPSLSDKPFRVIEHGRDFPQLYQLAAPLALGDRLKLVVIGNIGLAKGAMQLKQLAAEAERLNIELHVVGSVCKELADTKDVTFHGQYSRDSLSDIITKIRPHLSLILSIWRETWCHTLTESWAFGLPVVAFDIGAVGERVRKTEAGWLLENRDVESLISFFNNRQEIENSYQRKLSNVLVWQDSFGKNQTVTKMAKEYRELYQSVKHK